MKVHVSLLFEDGDRLDALYLLHFANGVRVDLTSEEPTAVLDLGYFEGRYVTPAGDVKACTFREFAEGSMHHQPIDPEALKQDPESPSQA